MSVSVYQISIPVFIRGLTNLSAVLAKGEQHAISQQTDPSALVNAKLYDDMRPLSSQVQLASDSVKFAAVRLGQVTGPSFPDDETTFAELQMRIAKTIEFLQSVDPAAFDGAESRDVVVKIRGNAMNFGGLQYLSDFVWPNFYFHLTTAYAILRNQGVPLGKMDFLGGV